MSRQTNTKETVTARMIAPFVKFFMVPLPKISLNLLPCPGEDKENYKKGDTTVIKARPFHLTHVWGLLNLLPCKQPL
jgi:hypothetical protein